MTSVHCAKFPDGCMALGENATMPTCGRTDCPGMFGRRLAAAVLNPPQTYDGTKRPSGSNADEWHLFLCTRLCNRPNHIDGLSYMAVQIAEAIDDAKPTGAQS